MTPHWNRQNCSCTNIVAHVVCTWLTSCRSALPGGASMVLHLHLIATYKRHEVQPRLLFCDVILSFTFIWPLEKLNTLMAYLLLIVHNIIINISPVKPKTCLQFMAAEIQTFPCYSVSSFLAKINSNSWWVSISSN